MRDEHMWVILCFWLSLLKKVMRVLFIAIMLLAAVSCGIDEPVMPGRNDGVWTGPGMNEGKEDPDKTVWYVTLLDYPDGYDWRADKDKGSVKCSLVVLANGIPMMKIPVGDRYETASDPDMHRILGGHIYTDYSSEDETVVKKDGKMLFRYPGREIICGMVVDSSGIHTLGEKRDGQGFSYRINGNLILERFSGRTFGRLQKDGNDICFAFSETVGSAADGVQRYYHVRNGDVSQTALREDVKHVWDIVSYGGEVIYLADIVGVAAPVLFHSESMELLHMPASTRMTACRLAIAEGRPVLEGIYASPGKSLTGGIWRRPDQCHAFPEGLSLSSMCLRDGSISCILNPSSSSHPGKIFHNDVYHNLPDGYHSMGSNTVMFADGILQAGLSSKSCGKPVIWRDGQSDTLDYNGYVTFVTTNRTEDVMLPKSASWTGPDLW